MPDCVTAGSDLVLSLQNYLEAARVGVDIEVLDGDPGIVTHQLSAVCADR